MIKNILVLISLIFVLNCSTTQQEVRVVVPSQEDGCAQYIGDERYECLDKAFEKMQKEINADSIIIPKRKERIDQEYILVYSDLCKITKAGEKFNCKPLPPKREYDPTFFGKLMSASLPFGTGLTIGIILGMVL